MKYQTIVLFVVCCILSDSYIHRLESERVSSPPKITVTRLNQLLAGVLSPQDTWARCPLNMLTRISQITWCFASRHLSVCLYSMACVIVSRWTTLFVEDNLPLKDEMNESWMRERKSGTTIGMSRVLFRFDEAVCYHETVDATVWYVDLC